MTIANSLAGDVMMQLGEFQFGISTAVYQELTRTTEHTWASQARFGQLDALQYTGPGADAITLPGVIFPEYRGGVGQLEDLRAMAADAQPQLMMSGDGNVLGLWVIERVEEKQTVFGGAGVPRRQEFTVALRKFEDVAAGLVQALLGVASLASTPAAIGDLSTPAAAVASVSGLADRLKGLATSSIASLKGSLAGVTGIAGQLGAQAASIKGALGRGIDAATGLQRLATGTLSQLKALPTLATARLGVGNISQFATGMLTQTSSAQLVLKGAVENLSGGLTSQAANIMNTATGNLGTLSNTARDATASATKLKGLIG